MARHIPVMLNEVIDLLHLSKGDNVIDCTLGDAGHAEKILELIVPGILLGIDNDVEAILSAKNYLYRFEKNFVVVRGNFSNLEKIVLEKKIRGVKAVLMDLGWSSPQFTERNRGFSFQNTDEELDMRYNPDDDSRTAAHILNHTNVDDLERIFWRYGEEKYSRQIAQAIVAFRSRKAITKVGELVEIIISVVGHQKEKIHPATRVFQALRLEVNNELENLKQALPQAIEVLETGGRLAVISFHSLEDRIIKQWFKKMELAGRVKIINKKPISPSQEEKRNNIKSRSAKLRVLEKIK